MLGIVPAASAQGFAQESLAGSREEGQGMGADAGQDYSGAIPSTLVRA
ncbi:MAG TPA: hypothetical protein VK762_38365 [Polyangiaceae bacterium]|jgi:hypothetical protein|nr:hypothetical protein [Polyangiaceae bacterium]